MNGVIHDIGKLSHVAGFIAIVLRSIGWCFTYICKIASNSRCFLLSCSEWKMLSLTLFSMKNIFFSLVQYVICYSPWTTILKWTLMLLEYLPNRMLTSKCVVSNVTYHLEFPNHRQSHMFYNLYFFRPGWNLCLL